MGLRIGEQPFSLPLHRRDERFVRPRVEHKNGVLKGFTKKYKIDQLVYHEFFQDIESAHREREAIERLVAGQKKRSRSLRR